MLHVALKSTKIRHETSMLKVIISKVMINCEQHVSAIKPIRINT
jgi:hypothetical protein